MNYINDTTSAVRLIEVVCLTARFWIHRPSQVRFVAVRRFWVLSVLRRVLSVLRRVLSVLRWVVSVLRWVLSVAVKWPRGLETYPQLPKCPTWHVVINCPFQGLLVMI
jgi:hypothetical protein